MTDLRKQLANYRLTTAEILYHLPDHRELLQTYVWQDYDLVPEFPILRKFLDYWRANLNGPLHSVLVAHVPLIGATRYRHVHTELVLH